MCNRSQIFNQIFCMLYGCFQKKENSLLARKENNLFSFNYLVKQFYGVIEALPDTRNGLNKQYRIADAALSAFSVFFTQSPSFLAHQKKMQDTKGKNNAQSLFHVESIPSDNQIRNLLDPVSPSCMTSMFDGVFNHLHSAGYLEQYRSFNQTLLIPLDGVNYFSSNKIHCKNCNTKKHKNGETTYLHRAITPVIVSPDNPHVISLAPEFMTPQDGYDKQDSEQAASKRWLKEHGHKYKELGVTILGDDLFSHQPICQAILNEEFHFILTCKPESHITLYEYVDGLSSAGEVKTLQIKRKKGKKIITDTYRFINKLPIRDGDDALQVNWCELVTTNAEGNTIFVNSYITDYEINEENVAKIVVAGRARWKVENENNNTLKNHGYHLNHNFGHGKKYLSQLLLTFNLLAFLFHTVLSLTDIHYQMIRHKLPTRKTFFDDLRALTRYMHFENWNQLMRFMFKGLELEFPDTG